MDKTPDIIALVTKLTIAWVTNPKTHASLDAVPAFIVGVHAALTGLVNDTDARTQSASVNTQVEHVPAVSIRRSLSSPDHIISLIDGKPYRTLGRHLSKHGLTPETYRARYNLKPDYPMVAPAYSEARRAIAKKSGPAANRYLSPLPRL